MGQLMYSSNILDRGVFLNKWFENRISANKNVLLAFSGSTGSGKTYSCLSTGEGWYDYYFKEEYPIQNVCFGLGTLAKRINELHKAKKLRKGELFILEEAGANFGNLDFQNKLSKMFNYILQSFRSMNLIVIMNLPVLTMLNKSARQLIHGHFITNGIDYKLKITKVKPFFHQLNQMSGKSYWKYPRVKYKGKVITLQRLTFVRPSERLVNLYEINKKTYVFDLTEDFVAEAERSNQKELLKTKRPELSHMQMKVLDHLMKGIDKYKMAEMFGLHISSIEKHIQKIKHKGYDVSNIHEVKNSKTEVLRMEKSPTLII